MGYLSNLVYNIILILALILILLLVTPMVVPKTRYFSVGAKKDAVIFAANLVTKIL